MSRLPEQALIDLAQNACTKAFDALSQTLQLVDDPVQRSQIGVSMTAVLFGLTMRQIQLIDDEPDQLVVARALAITLVDAMEQYPPPRNRKAEA